MAGSDITITALTATPTLRGTKLVATVNDPRNGAIPNLAADSVEFYAATVNNFAFALKVVEGPGVASGDSEALHAGLVEEQNYFYWADARNKIGSVGAKFPVSDTAGILAKAIGQSGLAFGIANASIRVDTNATDGSVAVNALKISINTSAGNAPSAGDPIFAAFRNATLSDGGYITRAIDYDLSLTLSPGSTLGIGSSNTAARIWLGLFDDAGIVRLAAANLIGTASVGGIDESELHSSTAEGGSGGADSKPTLYSPIAVTSKALRLIGNLTWNSGFATPGNWTLPDVRQLMGYGIKKPGEVVKAYKNGFAGYVSPTVIAIPLDNSIPQISEGNGVLSLPVTPTSPANVFRLKSVLNASRSTAGPIIHAVFRGDQNDAIEASIMSLNADEVGSNTLETYGLFNASSVTFSQRYGGTGGASVAYNGTAASQLFNGTLVNKLLIEELMG